MHFVLPEGYRDMDDEVQSLLLQYVEPYAYWNSYELPEGCPLHPKQDM